MNLKFLGDALDHWKGSLFASLQEARLLQDFSVDPVAIDLGQWQPPDFELYAQLLRVTTAQIVRHTVGLHLREAYFGEIPKQGDVFLDPDTGIATSRLGYEHVAPGEIGRLLDLDSSGNRIVVVYQHIRAKVVSQRVDEVKNALADAIGSYGGCSYESPTVAMLFLSRRLARVAAVAEHFRTSLGRHSANRIRRFDV